MLTCERALDSLVTSGRPLPAAGPSHVGLAEIAYQRDELDLARRHATEGIALCRQFVHNTPLANGLATLAMIRQATGDPAGALEAITEAGQASPGPAGLLNPVPAQRARLLLAQGNLPGAARFPRRTASARTTSRTTHASPGTWRWPGSCSPRTGPARRWHCWTGCTPRRPPRQDRQPHRDRRAAGAGAGRHRRPGGRGHGPGRGARAGLPAALRAGLRRRGPADGRAARPADRGSAHRPASPRSRSATWPGSSGPSTPGRRRDPVPGGIVDPLTSRELEVLKMLAAGRSNQAIDRELVVTLDTVKKHVGHVLGKLGAANRTEAVAPRPRAEPGVASHQSLTDIHRPTPPARPKPSVTPPCRPSGRKSRHPTAAVVPIGRSSTGRHSSARVLPRRFGVCHHHWSASMLAVAWSTSGTASR